jgi:hypothetical protein
VPIVVAIWACFDFLKTSSRIVGGVPLRILKISSIVATVRAKANMLRLSGVIN